MDHYQPVLIFIINMCFLCASSIGIQNPLEWAEKLYPNLEYWKEWQGHHLNGEGGSCSRVACGSSRRAPPDTTSILVRELQYWGPQSTCIHAISQLFIPTQWLPVVGFQISWSGACDGSCSKWRVGVFEGCFGTQRNTKDGVNVDVFTEGWSTTGTLYISTIYLDT